MQRKLARWPPPGGEPLGQERAEDLVATLLLVAVRSRAPLISLVNAYLDAQMMPRCVGAVHKRSTGHPEQKSVQRMRDGRLTWRRD